MSSSPTASMLPLPSLAAMYASMVTIRRLEETFLQLFSTGAIAGTTHTCIGQEADAVGVAAHLDPARDVVLSGHRCHGHYLAFTGDLHGLVHEVLGRTGGVCGGIGGSQHLCAENFLANGVQGSIAPVAAGMALAARAKGDGAVTVVFLGDGTLGQGVVYETLNLAALWSLPLLVVLEDNGYAQTTPKRLAVAGSIPMRAEAFGIRTVELASTDVLEIGETAGELITSVRERGEPAFLLLDTYRLAPHSKGDETRDPDEVAAWRERDPLLVAGRRLSDEERARIDAECERLVAEAVETALASPVTGSEPTL